jgi:hypothetical protein
VWRSDWRHCPRCATPLQFGERGGEQRHVLHCPACGLVIYDNPAPTASALVTDGGRLMLTRRAGEPARGMWDIPGGFIDPGEHPEQTIRRELAEETGLEVRVGELVGFFCDTYGEGGVSTPRSPAAPSRRPTTSPRSAGSRSTLCLRWTRSHSKTGVEQSQRPSMSRSRKDVPILGR